MLYYIIRFWLLWILWFFSFIILIEFNLFWFTLVWILYKNLFFFIQSRNIYYYPNLTYIANSQCNIYLPDVSVNPFYTNISFKIINNISDSIFLLSTSENCLINSTFFNSVQGDKDMAVEGKRIIQLTSTMINDTYFWNILIN
jgi:hypothetical protein